MNSVENEKGISICVPVYNGANTIADTLINLLKLNYSNFEIIINDNRSTDNTLEIVKKFKSKKIKIYENNKHVSCGENIFLSAMKSINEIIVFQCADDLFENRYLKKINEIYHKYPEVKSISRNYFWFNDNKTSPIRIKTLCNSDKIINIKSTLKDQIILLETFDNISGISVKKKYLKNLRITNFPFIETASFMLKFLCFSDIYLINEPLVAIRIHQNNTSRQVYTYRKSTTLIWRYIFNKCLKKNKLSNMLFINSYGKHFESLVQLRCFSGYKALIREIIIFIKIDKMNLLNLKLLFYALLTLFTPRALLIFFNQCYKKFSNRLILDRFAFKKFFF
jgi:glycosyltransferase involved in cell wall biosynthesis